MPHLLPDWKAPWQPLRSGGRRVRLLLSANEVGTWGSASLRLSSSTIHRTIDAEGRIICECLSSDTIFSSQPKDGLHGCRVSGVTHIRFCPVGKITNGSEIAVPQSGSALSKQCSHANPQSAHKPEGWGSPSLPSDSDTSRVCSPKMNSNHIECERKSLFLFENHETTLE